MHCAFRSASFGFCQLWPGWEMSAWREHSAVAEVITIEALAFLPGSSEFQVASTTLAGQYLGAGDPRRALGTSWMACGACSGLMTVVAIGVFIGGRLRLARQFGRRWAGRAGRLAVVLARSASRSASFRKRF